MRAFYKIFHTTCHTGWGGLERRIFNEAVWMRENDHKIILAAPKDTPLFRRAKEAGFKVYGVNFKRLSTFRDYGFLKKILYNEKPDIINVHGNRDAKLALYAAKNMEVPCRILSRHISAHVRSSWYNRLIYKKWAHYIFTTAGYTTEHLKKVFKLKDMQVFSMPSGIIPPEELPDRTMARNALASELGLDGNARFIGFIGRVSKDKGIDILINAFGQVSVDLPNHHLVIVGSGDDKEKKLFQACAEKTGISKRIHFAGFKEDVWPLHRALDCHVLASRNPKGIPFEGVPQALLEAMYAQIPVVAANSGGITDVVTHNETGLLHEPGNENDLARQISSLFVNPAAARQRARAAEENIRKHHTIDAMGRDIIRIYRLHQVRMERTPYTAYNQEQ